MGALATAQADFFLSIGKMISLVPQVRAPVLGANLGKAGDTWNVPITTMTSDPRP